MTAYRRVRDGGRYAVVGCKLKQNANEGCNSCASVAGLVLCFIACFILLVIAPIPTCEVEYVKHTLPTSLLDPSIKLHCQIYKKKHHFAQF